MSAIESRAINWDLIVQDKEDDESLANNAKYAISIARKLGANIFLVWEDIKDVKPKMLMTFAAGLYDVFLLNSQLKTEKDKIKADLKING